MKKALMTIAFSGLLMTACGSGAEKLNEAGNAAFAEQDYARAVEKYQEAVVADPELAAPVYNTASALYRQEAYDQVPAALQVAMTNADEILTQQSHYNLGNSLFKAEDYAGAVEAYKEALRFDPQDLDAKVNLELALRKLQEQEQQNQEQQEQDNQEQENQDQNQEQDQENQDQQEGQEQQNEQEQQGEQEQEQEQQEQEGSEGEQNQENQDQQQEPGEQDQEDEGQQGEQEQEQEQDQSREPEQADPQEGQDGEDPQDDPQDGEQGADPQEPDDQSQGNESDEPQEAQPGVGQLAEQLEGLSEEQARQLLIAAAQGTETLQEYLQQIYVFPTDSVEQDW